LLLYSAVALGGAAPAIGYDDGIAALALAEACGQSARAAAPVHS
jgi:myo-inositol 2-dehydrogenase/D-chiro-inositol 1-dehydrogenase